jgi:hypothetical protein
MRPAENIKRLIKNLHDTTSAQMDERVLGDVLRALDESEKTSAATKPNIRRTIMKSPITKLAAAAVIIVGAVLSVTIWDKTTPTAYALEQTIQASHSVRYLHIKSFMVSISDEPIECWVEFDPSGQIKNMRINKPAWMDPADGETVIVWKDAKMEFWIKKKNFLFIQKDQEIAAQVLSMVEQLDPKHAATNIQQAQEESDTKVEIDEPENKAEPITITATSLVENDLPFQRVILFVDQATKLLNSVEIYQLKDGKYIHVSTVEFYDYDIPIDSKMFTLDNIPSDAMLVDQTTQEIGLLQGDLTDNEIAVEVVRQFFEALIAQDYAKAGQMFGGVPADRIQKIYGRIRFIRIVSLGEPVLNPVTAELKVPYVVEIEENGVITKWKTKYNYIPARQVHGQPGRWATTGAPLGI